MNKPLLIAFSIAFFLLTFLLFVKGQPEFREKRIYHLLKPHIPYTIEKKMSGLYIKDQRSGEKIEPNNAEVYNVLDNLEKDWGKSHLRLHNDKLTVLDDNNKTVETILLQNEKERGYIHHFFGL